MDTLKGIGMTDNSKVLFLDSNINKSNELIQQLVLRLKLKKMRQNVKDNYSCGIRPGRSYYHVNRIVCQKNGRAQSDGRQK